ncbi:MAG: hypothetical protein DHS20C16_14230 [Phycisphaerae bacterium]|nr:MAG: hypothetical protein DHS20C16_14230 [Phycisphaerae bacterium]
MTAISIICGGMLSLTTGCPDRPEVTQIPPFDPITMQEAIALVNDNNRGLQLTIKSRGGFARCRFTDQDGSKRRFDVDANLIVHCPRNMRLDMSVLGKSYFVFGSNDERYWVEQPDARALAWGRHDRDLVPNASDLIIRPELIVDALGISLIPEGAGVGPRQRLTDTHQQLIFLDDSGQISKEFWLSRFSPQLIDRVIFRDPMGQLVMDAKLSKYKPIVTGGPLIPHRFEVNWPATEGYMLLTMSGWKMLPRVNKDHPAFQFPLDRGAEFDHIVDLDVELDHIYNPIKASDLIRQQLEQDGQLQNEQLIDDGYPAEDDAAFSDEPNFDSPDSGEGSEYSNESDNG